MYPVYIVRHGHKDTMTGGITHLGRKQMRSLAKRIQEHTPEVKIVSSPMRRARDSTNLLASEMNISSYLCNQNLREGRTRLRTQEVSDAYDFIREQSHTRAVVAVTHRNTGTSIARMYCANSEYLLSFDYKEFLEGDAIYVPEQPCLIDFF